MGLCLAKPQDLSCALSLLSPEEGRMVNGSVGLCPSYFVEPAEEKPICLSHTHVMLFLAHTQYLQVSVETW